MDFDYEYLSELHFSVANTALFGRQWRLPSRGTPFFVDRFALCLCHYALRTVTLRGAAAKVSGFFSKDPNVAMFWWRAFLTEHSVGPTMVKLPQIEIIIFFIMAIWNQIWIWILSFVLSLLLNQIEFS